MKEAFMKRVMDVGTGCQVPAWSRTYPRLWRVLRYIREQIQYYLFT